MKKTISMILAVSTALSMTACVSPGAGQSSPTGKAAAENKDAENGKADGKNDGKADGKADGKTVGAAKVLQVGFTTSPNENDPYNVFAEELSALVEEKSGGSMRVDVFSGGQLGQEREMLEGMQMGTVDMGVITNAYMSMFVPEAGVFDLPFIFRDYEQANRVLDGELGQKILDLASSQGFTALAWGEGGFRHLVTMNTPVRKPEDMKGLKIRRMETTAYLNTYAALGVNAVPMAWAETLTGLQQKTIEGLDIPVSVIYSNGFPEIAHYLNMTNQFYSPLVMCVSNETLKSLSEEQQQILRECAVEAGRRCRAHNEEVESSLVDEMESQGMTVVRDVDYDAFRETLGSFYDGQKDSIGAEYVDGLMAMIGE